MDEDRLAAALRDATDDVVVPRDLVRGAERLGRARRARRRSAATTLAVAAVVVAGGALVVPQIGAGAGESASSTAAGADSAASGAGSGSAPSPEPSLVDPTFRSGPQAVPESGVPSQGQGRDDQAPSATLEDAACDSPLVVAGAPARAGSATSVPAGQPLEITGPPLCGPLPPGSRYVLVLAPGSQAPAALAEVVPAEDGSFSVRVTLPPTTPPGAARLSVTGSPRPGHGADLDVLPPDPDLQPAPTAEEPP